MGFSETLSDMYRIYLGHTHSVALFGFLFVNGYGVSTCLKDVIDTVGINNYQLVCLGSIR